MSWQIFESPKMFLGIIYTESELLNWIISVKNDDMSTSEPIRELKAVVDLSTKIGQRI